jgi:hypothetical protein
VSPVLKRYLTVKREHAYDLVSEKPPPRRRHYPYVRSSRLRTASTRTSLSLSSTV